jgi:Sulfotransferase family
MSLLEELEKAFGYPGDEVDYLCNIGRRYPFLYFEVPKVACSSIKRTLQLLEATSEIGAPSNIHDKKNSPLIGPLSSGLTYEQLFTSSNLIRFAFVRNPYSRILSCYLEKIVSDEMERRHHQKLLGFMQTEPVTLLEFLQAVDKMSDRNREIHWKSQAGLIKDITIQYHYIGRFEQLERDFRHALTKIGVQPEAILLETITHHATNAQSKLKEFFGATEMALVQKIYETDFRRYNYSFELPQY